MTLETSLPRQRLDWNCRKLDRNSPAERRPTMSHYDSPKPTPGPSPNPSPRPNPDPKGPGPMPKPPHPWVDRGRRRAGLPKQRCPSCFRAHEAMMNRRSFFRAFTMGAAGLLVPKTAYFFLRGNPLALDGPTGFHSPTGWSGPVADIAAMERHLEYFWSHYQIKPDFIAFRDEETRRMFDRAIAPRRRRDRCRNSRVTASTR